MSSTKVGEVNNKKNVKSTKRIVGVSFNKKEQELLRCMVLDCLLKYSSNDTKIQHNVFDLNDIAVMYNKLK